MSIFICIFILIVLALSVSAIAFQWNQITRTSPVPLLAQSSPIPSNLSTPTTISQDQQIISQAQQDVNVANTIISWSSFFIAFKATAVAIAGFLGIREFHYIRKLRTEFEEMKQQIVIESQTFMDAAYTFTEATKAYATK